MSALPARFFERLRAIHDDQALALVDASLRAPRRTSFRVNRIRSSVDDAVLRLVADGVACEPSCFDDAFVLVDEATRAILTRHPLVVGGAVYVQTLSSMIPPRALAPAPDDEVLDLAAAPGGKAIHIADLMQNRGRLAVVEPSRDRFFRLRANLETAGVSIAALYMKDGAAVGARVRERFDRVLLDAPCSTEARFVVDDARTFDDWSEKKITRLARLQTRLLASALAALKVGGRAVYSTCSYAPEENEGVLAATLARFGDAIRIVDVPVVVDVRAADPMRPALAAFEDTLFPDDVVRARRVLPTGAFEASFVAVIEKVASLDDGPPTERPIDRRATRDVVDVDGAREAKRNPQEHFRRSLGPSGDWPSRSWGSVGPGSRPEPGW